MSKTSVGRSMGPLGIPDRMFIKLSYADHATFPSAGASGSALLEYYGNSIFDCGMSNDNHHAMGQAQWLNFYKFYRVRASKIHVTVSSTVQQFYQPSSGNEDTSIDVSTAARQYFVNVRPAEDNTYNGFSINENVVDPYSHYTLVGTALGQGVKQIKHYCTTKKITGYKNLDMADTLSAAMGAAPTTVWYWLINATESDGTTASGAATHLQVLVRISYYVELFGRENQNMATN